MKIDIYYKSELRHRYGEWVYFRTVHTLDGLNNVISRAFSDPTTNKEIKIILESEASNES